MSREFTSWEISADSSSLASLPRCLETYKALGEVRVTSGGESGGWGGFSGKRTAPSAEEGIPLKTTQRRNHSRDTPAPTEVGPGYEPPAPAQSVP